MYDLKKLVFFRRFYSIKFLILVVIPKMFNNVFTVKLKNTKMFIVIVSDNFFTKVSEIQASPVIKTDSHNIRCFTFTTII